MKHVREPVAVELFHQIASFHATDRRDHPAVLTAAGQTLSYAELEQEVARVAGGFHALGIEPGERVVINLPKSFQFVIALFAITRVGAVAVPTHPNLPGIQLQRIIDDCRPAAVVSTVARMSHLGRGLLQTSSIRRFVCCDDGTDVEGSVPWSALAGEAPAPHHGKSDTAAILYTSGSSGTAKGVVLSHDNLVLGAKSVAHYLDNSASDRILSVLPLSFDAGLSQVTTGLLSGASVVLLDYVFPADLVRAVEAFRITGLTGIPSLWQASCATRWPRGAGDSLRYFANTGGKLHRTVLERLCNIFPNAEPYLMYGLTEAFRSTFLEPSQALMRPDSVGRAIPNAEVFVLREDGSPCAPLEQGEIVHTGPLVARGYWNGCENSYARFADAPACAAAGGRAVWTGDLGYQDADGYLYFVGRRDEMLKISGYRVSLIEVESAAMSSPLVGEACAVTATDDDGHDHIWLAASPRDTATGMGEAARSAALLEHIGRSVIGHAVPKVVVWMSSLPKDLNGKINRHHLKAQLTGRLQ